MFSRPRPSTWKSQLGWKSVYAYNTEGFGPDSLLGRNSDQEVVLTRTLRDKLVQLNPGLPDVAYDDAVRQISAIVASQTMVATNREKYGLMRDGVQVTFRNDKGERVRDRLRIFDFAEPENNDFLCVRELWVRGDLYRRRADLVGFVNGLPLLFMECKNLHKNLKTAFEQNFSDYRDTIPHLFHHNAIVMFGNGEEAKIGSITSKWEHFHDWKRLAEDEPGAVDMETLLKGVCNKRNLMDLVENFILFDESSGEPKKILARNHQFLGVNRAMESVRNRKERQGRLGVFWHTQGAGKSYSMVMFTRKVHRKLGGNFTFLVLTDREDLDTQIYKTFAGCGVVNHDREPCRAADGRHLGRLLGRHKSYIFSLIQKFNQDVDPDEGYTRRDDIIVITDEAHRTQYGTLALNIPATGFKIGTQREHCFCCCKMPINCRPFEPQVDDSSDCAFHGATAYRQSHFLYNVVIHPVLIPQKVIAFSSKFFTASALAQDLYCIRDFLYFAHSQKLFLFLNPSSSFGWAP